jgi:hypothetical protein
MDPITALGAAGSVVGIAGFGIQLAEVLYKIIDRYRSARQSLQDVTEYIETTTFALKRIQEYLKLEARNQQANKALQLFSPNALLGIKETADKCLLVFWRVEATVTRRTHAAIDRELLLKLQRFNNDIAHDIIPRLFEKREWEEVLDLGFRSHIWWTFNLPKLDNYTKQLSNYQQSLTLMFTIVSLGELRDKQHKTGRDYQTIAKAYQTVNVIAFEGNIGAIVSQLTGKMPPPQPPPPPPPFAPVQIVNPYPSATNLPPANAGQSQDSRRSQRRRASGRPAPTPIPAPVPSTDNAPLPRSVNAAAPPAPKVMPASGPVSPPSPELTDHSGEQPAAEEPIRTAPVNGVSWGPEPGPALTTAFTLPNRVQQLLPEVNDDDSWRRETLAAPSGGVMHRQPTVESGSDEQEPPRAAPESRRGTSQPDKSLRRRSARSDLSATATLLDSHPTRSPRVKSRDESLYTATVRSPSPTTLHNC